MTQDRPLPPDEVLPAAHEPPASEPEDRGWVREAVLAVPNLIKLLGRLMRDSRVPLRTRAFALVVLGYLLSPIDLIPDAIPVLGQTDDLFLVALALHHLLNSVGEEVLREHWDGSADILELIKGVLDWGSEAVPWPLRRAVSRYVTHR